MVRPAVAISAFIAGAATALLALYVALRTAPIVIMAQDMVDALVVAADRPLSQFPGGSVVYVKSSLGPLLLEDLQRRHPSLTLRPYAERPEDKGCDAKPGAGRPLLPCERDDFLKLEVFSSPTRGTMLVGVGTSNTFGQLLLLKLWGRWRVLVDRTAVA
jgi:hypothetical protein